MRVPKVVVAVFVILGISLIVLNLALVRQDRVLANRARGYELNLQPFQISDYAPPFSGTSLSGERVFLNYQSGPSTTLLFVFSPTCPECTVNWSYWEQILKRRDPVHTRLLALNLGPGLSTNYVTQLDLSNTEVFTPESHGVYRYLFRYTPQTVLIGTGGKVEGAWFGVLHPADVKQIEEQTEPTHVPSPSERPAS